MKENIPGNRAKIKRLRVKGEEGKIMEVRECFTKKEVKEGASYITAPGRMVTALAPCQEHSWSAHLPSRGQSSLTGSDRAGRVRGGEVKVVMGPRSCSALLTKPGTLTSTLSEEQRGGTHSNLGVNRIASADVLRVDSRDKLYSRKT